MKHVGNFVKMLYCKGGSDWTRTYELCCWGGERQEVPIEGAGQEGAFWRGGEGSKVY